MKDRKLRDEHAKARSMLPRTEANPYIGKAFRLPDGRTIFIKVTTYFEALEAEVQARAKLATRVAAHEGRRARSYDDSEGVRTVGIGCNLERGDARRRLASVGADYDKVFSGEQALTDAQIDSLFKMDLDEAIDAACRVYEKYGTLPETARGILVEMIFQLGPTGVSGFPNMLAALDRRDWTAAADHMLDSKWYRKQTPRRAKELSDLMRSITEK